MNKMKQLTIAMLAALFTLTSCLDDDSDAYTYTDDTAITAFTLGTLKYTVHTKASDGSDSTYQTTRDCSKTKFYIDNQNRAIYNPDSLPIGIDVRKIICTITAKNSGTVVLQSMTSDSLSYYSSTDSIDFSQPRKVRVYSNSGQASREYTITVNVHKEYADSMTWARLSSTADFTSLEAMRAHRAGSYLFLFGLKDGATYLWRSEDGRQWTKCAPNFNHLLAASTCESATVKDDMLYIAENGNILRTADGDTWEQLATATPASRLVAATPVRLYAYTADGQLIESQDNGLSWTSSTLDDDASLLPTENLNALLTSLKTNSGAYRTTLIGTTATGAARIWSKIDEADAYAHTQAWTYYNVAESTHTLPALATLQAAHYDGGFLALGQTASGATDSLRLSYDGGLSWTADTLLTLPTALNLSGKAYALTTDSAGQIYIVSAADGTTWTGRLNRVAWKEDDKYITE